MNTGTRHLYDFEEPEPTFEAPTPLRSNRSLPDNIGRWRNGKTVSRVNGESNHHFPDHPPIDHSTNIEHQFSSTNHARRASQSQIDIPNSDYATIEDTDTNRLRYSHRSNPNAEYHVYGIGDKVARMGLTVVLKDRIYRSQKDEHVKHSTSTESSPRFGASPRLFGESLLSGYPTKKVNVSNFDISVIAPPSF